MSLTSRIIPQAAAVPIYEDKIGLITSSNGRRWVVPKGLIDAGMNAEQAALQEAWEEAGLRGTLRPGPVGRYQYEKYGSTCDVAVYVLDVTEVADDWPEGGVRRRDWLTPNEAANRVEEPGLQDILRRVGRPGAAGGGLS